MFSHCFSYFSRYFLILFVLQKSLLTNFFAHFLAAREFKFLVPFLVTLALQAGTPYMHPHISGTEHVAFLEQDACGNLVVDSLLVMFPFSAFYRRFLVQTSVGQTQIIPFLLTKILKLTLSCVT
jgi:hypothetical protein